MCDCALAEGEDGDMNEDDCLGGRHPYSGRDSMFDSIPINSQSISNIDLSTLGRRQDGGTDFTLTI